MSKSSSGCCFCVTFIATSLAELRELTSLFAILNMNDQELLGVLCSLAFLCFLFT